MLKDALFEMILAYQQQNQPIPLEECLLESIYLSI
jgi:predicted RNase H-like HicB family nuclease